MQENAQDVEKSTGRDGHVGPDISEGYVDDGNAVHKQAFTAGDSLYSKLQRFAGKYGVEQRGIERVPDDERTDASLVNAGTLWLSANMTVSTFALGALAVPVFNLGFVAAALTIVFINILGIMPVAFFSTFGPKFGLRQMVLSRFYFGYHATKLVAIFNILACIGWSSVNVIVGAQLFHAVNSNMPGWSAILVLAILTLIIGLFGYKFVHVYEKYSWIPTFIVFIIVLGEFAHSGNFNPNNTPLTGPAEAGAVLSFAASVFGFATAWCSFAADYTVYQPVTTKPRSVFLSTFAGLFFPLCFAELLGAAVVTATVTNAAYTAAYQSAGVGGVLAQVLMPPLGRFGQFCVVVLALSVVANNCPNVYSVALSLQVFARPLADRVPRFVWSAVATCVYVAVSVPGYDRFEAWLENFMLVIGYWSAIYEGVALAEHFVFRRGCGYRPDDYVRPRALPPGFAAVAAFCFGVAGAVLGMAQVWWTGPVGRLCGGEFGGDVGFELAFCYAAVSYVVFRSVERSYFGR